ncbi:hypothetical protein [Nocardiopsis ansamitocini]|uniref:Biopolymer transporter Tol n=1 Tax=Nocardiopsis ansamitocini TaxID=1670832 RepID=A0A9W6UJU6_9ACTN|nr:hypothetical protein [Nocardiopsis ansamitocini]GLU48425.1 hypothetical protein Nans01_27760 [Nocardiopsis ansamitocini]
MGEPQFSEDGHHIIVAGRRWRASDPLLPEATRETLVRHLMAARRAVARAGRDGDTGAERVARARVQQAKLGLGERGVPWWECSTAERRARWESALHDLDARAPHPEH